MQTHSAKTHALMHRMHTGSQAALLRKACQATNTHACDWIGHALEPRCRPCFAQCELMCLSDVAAWCRSRTVITISAAFIFCWRKWLLVLASTSTGGYRCRCLRRLARRAIVATPGARRAGALVCSQCSARCQRGCFVCHGSAQHIAAGDCAHVLPASEWHVLCACTCSLSCSVGYQCWQLCIVQLARVVEVHHAVSMLTGLCAARFPPRRERDRRQGIDHWHLELVLGCVGTEQHCCGGRAFCVQARVGQQKRCGGQRLVTLDAHDLCMRAS